MVKGCCWAWLLIVVAAPAGLAQADEPAVRQSVASYVTAINARDLKAVSAMWSAKGSHTDRETGVRTDGREAIVKDIEAAFKEHPDSRLAGRVDSVRMIKPDVARIEGQTSIGSPSEDPTVSNFSAILLNEQGTWIIDSIEESPLPQPAAPEDALRELEWLVGHWVDDSPEAHVDTTFGWTVNRAFLRRSFVVETAEGETEQGTQIIGWDPRSRAIRSWTFNSDGSFGDGTWSRNGDDWLIKSSQTMADGQAASGTYILTRVDNGTISLRLVGHEVEGEPQPSGPEVKMVRIDETPPTAETTPASSAPTATTSPAPTPPAPKAPTLPGSKPPAPPAPKAPAPSTKKAPTK